MKKNQTASRTNKEYEIKTVSINATYQSKFSKAGGALTVLGDLIIKRLIEPVLHTTFFQRKHSLMIETYLEGQAEKREC